MTDRSATSIALDLPASLSPDSLAALGERLSAAAASPERVLAIRGADGVFCRGLDPAQSADQCGVAMNLFAEVLIRLRSFAKPTLAIVDGAALGGGLGLLAVCDVVLATEHATFGLPEALYGLLPAAIYPILLERLLPQKVRALALDGLTRDAAWALHHGLADELLASSVVEAGARRWIRRLARPRPGAASALRQLADEVRGASIDSAIRLGASRTGHALSDPEVLARLRSFEGEGLAPWGSP